MGRIYLVRDLMDKRVLARGGVKLGRVDGIVIRVRERGAPRVLSIELGAITLATRLNEHLGNWVAHMKEKLGVGEKEPVRIPFEKIMSHGIDIKVDVNADETAALEWEKWVGRIFQHIPGSGR